ncbi:hypothetical protein [Dactylosporangium salmoneum]|uniref:DUF1440 domain-containing protein n=1 Tax=Dactylosporangium salmoneum TaxID=53361 RepID=A0ABN3FC94_9ACTN
MASGLVRGALAGAAGTTALNATTYLDMAVRGRAPSDAPQDLIEKAARDAGLRVPGEGETREHRLQGLGPLVGMAVGVGVGALAGAAQAALARRGRRLPVVVGAALIAAGAMALADVPLKLFGISDPRTWSAGDWAGDIVPHLVYGAVTWASLDGTGPGSSVTTRARWR